MPNKRTLHPRVIFPHDGLHRGIALSWTENLKEQGKHGFSSGCRLPYRLGGGCQNWWWPGKRFGGRSENPNDQKDVLETGVKIRTDQKDVLEAGVKIRTDQKDVLEAGLKIQTTKKTFWRQV